MSADLGINKSIGTSHLRHQWREAARDPELDAALEEFGEIFSKPYPSKPRPGLFDEVESEYTYGGYISQARDGSLLLDGKRPKYLYRVVDPAEWEEAEDNGYLRSRGGYTRASAKPDERWRYQGPVAGVKGYTLEIDYDSADDWHASAEGYAATHKRIPLSRVRKIG